MLRTLTLTLLFAGLWTSAFAGPGGSKRIEVYDLGQNYYETTFGDTLGEIVDELLPNNPGKHEALKRDIVGLNPDAFIDNDPARMLADKRLRLPVYLTESDSRVDPERYSVESFSWGNIKRPK